MNESFSGYLGPALLVALAIIGVLGFLRLATLAHTEGAERVAAARALCIQEGGIWVNQTCIWSLKGKEPNQ